ncbi:hypothetical protein SK128_023026, partial [Halocaridina rubra]
RLKQLAASLMLAWAKDKQKVPSPFCASLLSTLLFNSKQKTKSLRQAAFQEMPEDRFEHSSPLTPYGSPSATF